MEDKFRIVPITNSRIIDMTGERYGRLMVLGLSPIKKGNNRSWVCQCECGEKTIVQRGHLISGHTSSCGCYNREQSSKINSKRKITHGQTDSRLYKVWINMKQRCNNSNATGYSRYGGRGIAVSAEWEESYEVFADWAMNNGYQDDLTIDRIDNDKGYEESNCRWVTHMVQNGNTRKNIMVEHHGQTHHLTEWSRILDIPESTLYMRHYRGDCGDHLFRPV